MKKTTIFAAVFISLVLAPAAALCRTDSPSARSLAMGDAVTAIGMGTDGLFVNPGAIGQVTQYSVNIGYGYANINQWHQASASFVDSQTNKWLTGGLAYTFGYADKAGDTMTHDIRVALGTKYATDKVFIGFGVGMRIMNLSSGRSKSTWYVDTDIGALLGIMKVFSIGITGKNLVQDAAQPKKNLAQVELDKPRQYWNLAPRKLAVGVGFSYSIFNMGIDCDVDFTTDTDGRGGSDTTPSLLAGMEFMIKNVVSLRGGVAWDRVGHFVPDDDKFKDEVRLSLGVGYVSKAVAVDVGYAHDVLDKHGFYLQTTVRVFLP
ncbi:MAG TPA: hypothetical protein PKG82_09500 [Myxococcota bacterium]|nr:hypothetical protein [Myxococcota bacterium]